MSLSPVSTSFRQPDAFRAFGTQQALLRQQRPTEDNLLDPKQHLSARRAIGLFTGGVAAGLGAGFLLKNIFKKPGAGILKGEHAKGFETNNILRGSTDKRDELNIAQNFGDGDGLSSLYRLIFEDKNQLKAFVPYVGSSIAGYLAGSAFQGTQETWVRREETKIRARLLNRLQSSFRQSIQTKQGMDNQLKEDTQKRIYQMLIAANVPNAHDLVVDMPLKISDTEALKINRDYFYQPTHRTVSKFKGNNQRLAIV